MARSMFNLKVAAIAAVNLSRLENSYIRRVVDGLVPVTHLARRGYSTVAPDTGSTAVKGIRPEEKQEENKVSKGKEKEWMPHPVTGYWVPEDHFGEVDVADRRKNLLGHGQASH